MPFNLHAKPFLILLALFLTSCATPKLDLKTEPLTGEEYYTLNVPLVPRENCAAGALVLKGPSGGRSQGNAPIKAILKLAHEEHDYTINPHETLTLSVDGERNRVEVITSFKEQNQDVENFPLYLPTGKVVSLGMIKDITRRRISFFLLPEQFSKIYAAKEVFIEIAAPNRAAPSLHGYPILLELIPENTHEVQEFKSKCTSNSLNNTREEK